MVARIGFKMPTIDKTVMNAVVKDPIDLVEYFLQDSGDTNSMLENRF